MSIFISLFMKFWGIKNDVLNNVKFVVPHGYGLLSRDRLPNAAKKTIKQTAKVLKEFPQAKVFLTNSNYLWPESEQNEFRLKLEEFTKRGVAQKSIVNGGGIANTIEEVEKAAEYLARQKLNHDEILIVVDQMHARRARQIWKKIFPNGNIKIRNVKGRWQEGHPAVFQRSELRWLLTNVLFYIAFFFIGVKLGKFHHAVE